MNHKSLALILSVLFFWISAPCHAEPEAAQAGQAGEVWVALSFLQKGPQQLPIEYYGTMDKKYFPLENYNGRGGLPAAGFFLKLSHVAWMDETGKIMPLSEARTNNSSQGYSRVMYFRVDTIVRIVELDPQFVKDNAAALTGKK